MVIFRKTKIQKNCPGWGGSYQVPSNWRARILFFALKLKKKYIYICIYIFRVLISFLCIFGCRLVSSFGDSSVQWNFWDLRQSWSILKSWYGIGYAGCGDFGATFVSSEVERDRIKTCIGRVCKWYCSLICYSGLDVGYREEHGMLVCSLVSGPLRAACFLRERHDFWSHFFMVVEIDFEFWYHFSMFLAVDVFRPSGALQYGGVSKVYINVALKLSCLAYLILYQDFKIDQFWCKF